MARALDVPAVFEEACSMTDVVTASVTCGICVLRPTCASTLNCLFPRNVSSCFDMARALDVSAVFEKACSMTDVVTASVTCGICVLRPRCASKLNCLFPRNVSSCLDMARALMFRLCSKRSLLNDRCCDGSGHLRYLCFTSSMCFHTKLPFSRKFSSALIWLEHQMFLLCSKKACSMTDVVDGFSHLRYLCFTSKSVLHTKFVHCFLETSPVALIWLEH
ncbi:hypothetical protein HNY73_014540 [Argiope bruennichi]|uniref:Uncharacterized protein n=1 Tax=Argiope bruennichi TaxID=94029 RepID=A0A8T0ETQ1_ARGBR|nr:hypothetical protein HNY73_014540 [Argiope bruennichi]